MLRPAWAALGIVGVLAIAAAWPAAPLRELGRASFPIFLVHVLAAVPARWLPWSVLTGTVLGIVIPYLLWRIAEAWSLPIFRWPARAIPAGGPEQQLEDSTFDARAS